MNENYNEIMFNLNQKKICPICRIGELELSNNSYGSNKLEYVCKNCNQKISEDKPKITDKILKAVFSNHNEWLETQENNKLASILSMYDIRGYSFADLDLSFLNFSYTDLTGCNFKNTRCFHTNFKYANCSETNFSNASLRGASIVSTDFTKSIMREIDLCNTSIKSANFSQADLLEGKFIGSSFKKCLFTETNMVATSFNNAKIIECNLENADMRYSVFTNSNLYKCNLNQAKLDYVQAYKIIIKDSKMQEASAQNTNFTEGTISTTNINGLNLLSATLIRSNLDDAILQFGGYGSHQEIISYNLSRDQLSSPWNKKPITLKEFAELATKYKDKVFLAVAQTFAIAHENYRLTHQDIQRNKNSR